MKRTLPLIAVGLLLAGIVGVVAATQANSRKAVNDTPTVGEFVRMYARSVGLAGERTSAEDSLGALRTSGMIGTSPLSLDSRLTEGDVVRLTTGANLGISTQNASREFTRAQTNTFFSVFKSSLSGPPAQGITPVGSSSITGSVVNTIDSDCPSGTNPNNCIGTDPRDTGKGKKVGLSNHFPN